MIREITPQAKKVVTRNVDYGFIDRLESFLEKEGVERVFFSRAGNSLVVHILWPAKEGAEEA